jgi:hypothetical protein
MTAIGYTRLRERCPEVADTSLINLMFLDRTNSPWPATLRAWHPTCHMPVINRMSEKTSFPEFQIGARI